MNEDGTEHASAPREWAAFHDGAPFDADAVVFGVPRTLDEVHPSHDAAPSPRVSSFGAVERVGAVDGMSALYAPGEPFAPSRPNHATRRARSRRALPCANIAASSPARGLRKHVPAERGP